MTDMLFPSSVQPDLHHNERPIVKKIFPTSQSMKTFYIFNAIQHAMVHIHFPLSLFFFFFSIEFNLLFPNKGIISAVLGARSVETQRCDNRTIVKVKWKCLGHQWSSNGKIKQNKPEIFQFLCYVDIASGTLFILDIISFLILLLARVL